MQALLYSFCVKKQTGYERVSLVFAKILGDITPPPPPHSQSVAFPPFFAGDIFDILECIQCVFF